MVRRKETEDLQELAKRYGFRFFVPNEKDATIYGTIEKTDMMAIEEANAKLRVVVEPRGTWNDEKEGG